MNKNPISTIFVCSPYRPTSSDPAIAADQLRANVERAKMACRLLSKLGHLPLAPHLYFTRFLDDADAGERADGITLGLAWLEQADEVWCFGSEITEGMNAEITRAGERNIPVRMLPEPTQLIEVILNEMSKSTHKNESEEMNHEEDES